MTEILEDYKIRLFREDDDGKLCDIDDMFPQVFGNVVPSVGDEIPSPMRWEGTVENYGLNGFWVVKRRVFLYAENQIVLICSYRDATPHDRDIF